MISIKKSVRSISESSTDCDMSPIKEETVEELYLKVMRKLSLENEAIHRIFKCNFVLEQATIAKYDDNMKGKIVVLGELK